MEQNDGPHQKNREPKNINIVKKEELSESITQSISNVLSSSNHQSLNNALLNSIVNALPGCAHIKTAEKFEYHITNSNTLKLFGMKEHSDLVGKDDHEVASIMKWRWPNGFANNLQEMDFDVLFNNNPIIGKEHEPYVNAEGSLVALSLTKIPLYDHEQNPYGILTFAIDSSNLKCSEKLRSMYYRFYENKKVAHKKFLDHLGINLLTKHGSSNSDMLSERELDALILIAKGKTAKEAARMLGLSNRTVETHIDNAKIKFKCNTKSELISLFLSCFRIS